MTHTSEPSAIARHLARNQELLMVLDRYAADRASPRTIDFFFYASGHPQALDLARELRAVGFDNILVADQPRDGRSSIQAVRIDSIDAVTTEHFVSTLVGLAIQHAAEFDGWGTSV